ncbi:MAG: hypothetical protein GWO10_08825, partial [candidate division Zixibacteria bacterium]|nr:hypothetical protein [candidate division Zixibacteria bacterium]NIW44738.1 hypothetical protein [Gammaproteobacteria bacterium]
LAKWFPKLCLAYGWKFKNLLVEDQSITWVVSTLGREMPIEMVSIIGTKLSERIFRVFPSYYDENPSGEYWAIPYYLETTNQVPADELRRLILHQIRQDQGI